MKLRTVLTALIGAGLLVWLLWSAGLPAVARAVIRLGALGFLAIVAFQLGLAVLLGVGWALLGRGRPDSPIGRYVWGRLIRDASGQALPFSQVGAVLLGGRALSLEGVSGGFATASTVTDLAVEFTGQVAFVMLGAALLTILRPHNMLGRPVLLVIGALILMSAGLVLAQSHGAPVVERLLRRVLKRDDGPGGPPVAEAFREIRGRPASVATAWTLHFAGWVLGGVQTWITLRFLDVHASLGGALVIDSLTAGAKAVGFLIPGSLGIQEGALVLLGHIFGVAPPAALALSLARRGRDLVIALPVLGIWHARHGDRIWRLAPKPTN
ncbi:MAG TPA: lysylphosphatidylglycerol synthase domain-containing protein [Caulobacteraceae bacterium]